MGGGSKGSAFAHMAESAEGAKLSRVSKVELELTGRSTGRSTTMPWGSSVEVEERSGVSGMADNWSCWLGLDLVNWIAI